jgi:Rrf2 family protein
MNISKKSQYGLRAMIFLAKNYKKNELLALKEISKAEVIPFEFLSKIFWQLEKAKLIKSKKGIGGGYVLAKNPQKITVKDIVEILEDTVPVNCALCNKKSKCISKNVWAKVNASINKALKSIKLSNLIK